MKIRLDLELPELAVLYNSLMVVAEKNPLSLLSAPLSVMLKSAIESAKEKQDGNSAS